MTLRWQALFLMCLLASCGGSEGDKSSSVAVPTTAPVVFVDVPDLTGQTTGFAQGAADMAGLSLLVVESPDLTGDPNVVIEQLPAAGEIVEQWSALVVRVPSPPVRLPEVVELSPEATVLLGADTDVRVGEAARTAATDVLEDNPEIAHNPFAVMARFDLSLSVEQIEAALIDVGGSVVGESLDGQGLYLIETLANPEQVIEIIEDKEIAVSVGLDTVLHLTATSNDPRLGDQWGLGPAPGVNAFAAWDITTGGSVVAVIDSGVDLTHPDLTGQIWTNPGEVPGNGLDDDANGLVDDVHGWDFHNWDADPSDDDGHGTHVAGTIAAVANNGIGIAGVAPGVRIMALKALGPNGGFTSRAIAGLFYAVMHGADISNHSYAGGDDPDLSEMIQFAGVFGHLVVAAAGNQGSNNDASPRFPASYPFDNVISVAAVDQLGTLAEFSNYGASSVDVAAPGVGILSTTLGGDYVTQAGTSMAAPHVSGMAALLRSVAPAATPSTIRQTLIDSAQPNSQLAGLMVSGGTVDAFQAIRSLDSDPPILTSTSPVDDAVGVAANTNIVLTFNEPVVTGVGRVDIYRAVDGALAEMVPVDPSETSQVTGSGTTTITINPAQDLQADTGYYVTINPGTFNDLVGNPYAGITDPTRLSFTTADVGEPTLVSSTPADGATGVAADTNITLVFSEDVDLGEGDITLVAVDGDTTLSTQVFDTATDRGSGDGQIAGHGTNTLSINPAGNLASHADYYLTVSSTAVSDAAGNSYAGMTDPTSLNFTTADTTAPQLVSTTPTTGAVSVPVDTNITLVFTEDVYRTDGNITIHDATNGGIAATISVTSGRVTIEGTTVTVDPAEELRSNADYQVMIDSGAFTDEFANPYSGMATDSALVFTTADIAPPQLADAIPVSGSSDVDADTNITLVFTEPVVANTGVLALHRVDNGSTVETIPATNPRVTGSGTTTITVDPAGTLDSGVSYYLRVDQLAFEDTAGNAFEGFDNPDILNFTTIDFSVPVAMATVPFAGEVGFPLDGDIVLTFSEPVYPVESPDWSQSFMPWDLAMIFDQTNHVMVVSDWGSAPADSISVVGDRVSGWGTSTITIDRSGNPGGLRTDTAYSVLIVPGSIVDASGNPFPGIVDLSTLSFNADTAGPVLGWRSPEINQAHVSVRPDLQVCFDEAVYEGGAGDVTIHRSSDGEAVFAAPVTGRWEDDSPSPNQPVFFGWGEKCIHSATLYGFDGGYFPPLEEGTNYYVNLAPGTIVDAAGNAFAGIVDSTTWAFKTHTYGAPVLRGIDGYWESGLSPPIGASEVALNTNLVLPFNVIVQAGSGTITIREADSGTVALTIPVPSWRVTGLGTKTVTIDPAGSLDGNTDYYVNIDAGTFQSDDGVAYDGLETTVWTFTTTSDDTPQLTTGLTLGSSNPADDATGVDLGSDITLTFDKPVYVNTGVDPVSGQATSNVGDITIYTGSGSLFQRIPATDWRVTGSGTDTITINPKDFSDQGSWEGPYYYVTIDGTTDEGPDGTFYGKWAFQDADGVPFAGITDPTTLNFATVEQVDTTAPTIVSATRELNTWTTSGGYAIVIEFSEVIQEGWTDLNPSCTNYCEPTGVPDGFVAVGGSGVGQTIDDGNGGKRSRKVLSPGNVDPNQDYYYFFPSELISDQAGNYFTGETLLFPGAASAPPALVSTTPVDGETNVPVDSDLTLVFNESVTAGSGDITIHNLSGGSIVQTISAASWRVVGSGLDIITVYLNDLQPDSGYYVNIEPSAFEDVDGDPFAGITNATTWTFTTGDNTPPVLVATSPLDNATDVAVDASISLTFDEPVYATTGTITIRRSTDGSFVETIPVSASQVTGLGTIKVTVNPTGTFEPETGYYVNVAAGTFSDINNNPYAGIGDSTTFNFTTEADTAPLLVTSTPADGATGISVATDIVLVFDKNVFAGTGNISLYKTTLPGVPHKVASATNWRVTGSGTNQITFDTSGDLTPGTDYYVNVDPGALNTAGGTPFAGITNTTTWNFTTAEAGIPTLVSTTPTSGATSVPVNSDITLTFSEPVYSVPGSPDCCAWMGGIVIYKGNATDNAYSGVEFDGTKIATSTGGVSGIGTTTITLDPLVDLPPLEPGWWYFLTIDPRTLVDAAGNSYVGIVAHNGSDGWTDFNFTTAAADIPALVSTSPADNAIGVSTDTTSIVFTFSEPVFAGAGEIRLSKNGYGGSWRYRDVTDSRFTGWGTTQITWDFDSYLYAEDTDWDVEIPAGAFLDADGNAYPGTVEGTLNFTTGDWSGPQLGLIHFNLSLGGSTNTPGATEVPVGHDIVLKFDETVSTVTGNVTIHRYIDGSIIEQVPVNGSRVTGSGTSTITVNPVNDFPEGAVLYVSVDSGAFVDQSGNPFVGDFQQVSGAEVEAGAYPDYTRFTTADASNNLLLVSTVPADGATGVSVDTTIVLNFNQNTCFGVADGSVMVHRSSDGLIVHTARRETTFVPGTLTGEYTTQLTVTLPPVLSAGTAYYITTPPPNTGSPGFHVCGVSNSSFAGITDTTTWNFTTESDTDEPTLVSSTPANGTTGVAVDANIVLTFVEPVDAETGNITIHKTADGSTVETIPAASGQVTGTGTTTITINPAANLSPNTGYYINVDATAFDDTDGNSFAGITGSTTVGFATIDTGAPTLASSTPADNAAGVALTTQKGWSPEIVLTFSEPVCATDGTSVRLRKVSDGSIVQTWPITAGWSPSRDTTIYPRCLGPGTNAYWEPEQTFTLEGASGTMGFGQGWPADTALYLDVDPGAFTDEGGNPWVTDATTLNFTTGPSDTTPPTVISATREILPTSQGNLWFIVVTFSEPVNITSHGSFTSTSPTERVGSVGSGGSCCDRDFLRAGGSGSNFVDPAVDYYWHFPVGHTTVDAGGNPVAVQVVHFPGSSAPVLNAWSPPVSIAVPVDTNIVLTFNKNVTTSSGNITIHQTSGGSVVETISAASGLVTGSGTTTITINPSGTLSPNTGYYVNVDSSAFTDTDGAAYPGITDSTTMSFTTGDSTPPVLVSTSPANGATGVPIDTEVVFTFDELVGSYSRFHGGYLGYSGVETYSGLTLHLASDGSVVDNTGFPDDGIAQISPSVLHWVDVMTGYDCGPPHSWLGCAADGHIVTADNNNIVSGCCAYLRAGNPVSWDLNGQLNSGVLMPGTTYYINMTATALADASGNAFPGISGSTAFTFTTEGSSSDTDAPVASLISVSPTTAAPGDEVTVIWSVVDETGVGSLTSDNYVNVSHSTPGAGQDFSSLLAGTTRISGDATNGNYQATLTVPDPTAAGSYGFTAMVKDELGNLAWRTLSGTLTVTSADTTSPTLVSSTPADNATSVAVGTNITLVFDEPVNLATGEITLVAYGPYSTISTHAFDAADDRGTGDGKIDGHGTNTLTLNPAVALDTGTSYYLTIDATAVTDTAGNLYAGIGASTSIWPSPDPTLNFTTDDTTAPLLVSSIPADDATDVAVDTNITLTFDEPVTVSSGSATIIRSSDGAVFEQILVISGQVSGSGTTVITFNPSGDLEAGTGYYVVVTGQAFKDAAGNLSSVIGGSGTLNFTTASSPFPSSLAAPVMTNISWNIFTFQTVYPVGLDCTTGYQYGFDLYRGFSNTSLTYNWDTSACGTSTPEFPPVTRHGWEDSSDIANHRFSWGEGGSWVPASGSVIQPGQSHSVRAWVSDNLGNKISSPFTEFTTLSQPDNQAPTLTAKWPYPGCGNDGGAGGCYESNGGTSRMLLQCSKVLELTFSEPVFSAAPGEWTWDPGLNPAYGLIQVYNVSVSGSYAQWNGAGGDSITVSGFGSNTLHLVVDDGMCKSSNPSGFGARIAPNALKDAAGNTFAGITGYYDWDWTIVNPPSNPSGQYSYPPGYSSP